MALENPESYLIKKKHQKTSGKRTDDHIQIFEGFVGSGEEAEVSHETSVSLPGPISGAVLL